MAVNNPESIPVLTPYNPLGKRHLDKQVAEALLAEPIHELPSTKFVGAGVYALYYIGDFPAYSVLANANRDEKHLCLIYVGRAVPDGARNGVKGMTLILARSCING